MAKYQSLRELYEITEWKDNCVYRTKKAGFAWITIGIKYEGPLQFNSVSTDLMKQLNYRTNRTVSDDTPDINIVTLQELIKK